MRLAVLLFAVGASAAQAPMPATPSFRVQVSSFVAMALREAPNDYAPYGDRDKKQIYAAALAPTFATCGALASDETAYPVLMICSSEWMPTATANTLYAEGAEAIRAGLPAKTIARTEALSGTWAIDDQTFTFFAYPQPRKPELSALILSSKSYRHLAKTPVEASVAKAIAEGLRALPDNFAGLPTKDGGIGFKEVVANFGPGLPFCRTSTILHDYGLECFTPAYVDSFDASFTAVKNAVTKALPAGFSAVDCAREKQCGWDGPNKERVAILIGVSAPEKNMNATGVRIMISRSQ